MFSSRKYLPKFYYRVECTTFLKFYKSTKTCYDFNMRNNPGGELLTRRVEKVLPTKEGLEKLMKKRKIRLYQGFDPTGSRLHLGHSIGLRKLMEFANLGHEVIFLFGTGTVLVGDPSQRSSARKLIDEKEIEKNIKDWKRQAAPLVDFTKVQIKRNGDWLTKLTLKELINIASNISAVQLFKREMFQRRINQGDTVWYHETMYPLLQGYDSVVMDVDLEIGGTDQEFNMLIGRELQRKMKNREKYVLTTPMIMGTDGKQMSKTTGNCVWLDDPPSEMFGKLMSMPDENIVPYLNLVTNMPLGKIQDITKGLRAKTVRPLQAKKLLAFEVVRDFHGEKEAKKAEKEFTKVFQKKEAPSEIPGIRFKEKELPIPELLLRAKLVSSKSGARRVVSQGGVKIDGIVQKDWNKSVSLRKGTLIKVGKRRFVKIA